jgi:hypothetical protein
VLILVSSSPDAYGLGGIVNEYCIDAKIKHAPRFVFC